MNEKPKQILAKDCFCCTCGKQAVCWWPIMDPDIPEHPYCRKCVDEAKMRVIIAMGLNPKDYVHL